jgi:predicted phosphodiesterase
MSFKNVIVDHRTIFRPLGGFEAAGSEIAKAVQGTDVSEAELLAQLDYVRFILESEAGAEGVMVAPGDQLASLFQSALNEHASTGGGSIKLVQAPAGGYEAQLDGHDFLGWFSNTGLEWIKQRLKIGRCDWRDKPGGIEEIPDNCRIAVLSDWGTGLYGAPKCASRIAEEGNFDLLLHLGDVYYSGTSDEMKERFLKFWPTSSGKRTRCLNGNHEMYAGGGPYFDMIASEFGQPASYFALRNKNWLLIGLDTSYTEFELHGGQLEWLRDLVGKANGRRVILFSHHQPYSSFGPPGRKLLAQVAPLLDAHYIFAWYWGHEHRCVVFERHPRFQMYGRCVGHSGFPEFRHDSLGDTPDVPDFFPLQQKGALTPRAELLDGPCADIPGHESKYSPHGYVILELDGRALIESYYTSDGTLRKEDPPLT